MRFSFPTFPSTIRMPWSGDIVQDIHPEIFSADYSGSPVIERKVLTEVAGYGRQLGWLTEAVLALATKVEGIEGKDAEAIAQIAALRDGVARIKTRMRDDLTGEAARALEALRTADPEAYRQLVAEAAKENAAPNGAAS